MTEVRQKGTNIMKFHLHEMSGTGNLQRQKVDLVFARGWEDGGSDLLMSGIFLLE
jgi:hypothetical protein